MVAPSPFQAKIVYIHGMANTRSDAPLFIATIGYVRSLKIGHLDIWCEGKREGGWPCHHNSSMNLRRKRRAEVVWLEIVCSDPVEHYRRI
jgi:hypothetical protein